MRQLRRAAVIAILATMAAACGGNTGGRQLTTVYITPPTQTVDVPSSSMEPTLHCARPGNGCEALVSDGAVVEGIDGREVKRGDIILFEAPELAKERCGAGGRFLKRVIALPGETWQEKNGFVYIDGKKLIEPYVKSDRRDTGTSYPARVIPPDMYFTMGDNRTQSCDSREWGPVPFENIIGRVVRVLRER